mmetsp:Transcript_17626/g.29772  ORF Transcript_17626/g.29772 Transcript_17626/m.29772 type:complete len:96 (+) Transcript_17626:958-1245(+)
MRQHPIREYVDVVQSEELQNAVAELILKLKQLFFIRKNKPQKGKYKKVQLAPKKRYLIGMREVKKCLDSQTVNMVIVAVNLEQVSAEDGLDDYLL